MTNYDKVAFANTLSDQQESLFASACERYGMTWGCDTSCPVLNAGKCELKDAECKDLWDEVRLGQNY